MATTGFYFRHHRDQTLLVWRCIGALGEGCGDLVKVERVPAAADAPAVMEGPYQCPTCFRREVLRDPVPSGTAPGRASGDVEGLPATAARLLEARS